jgi:hypothetical protein
MLPFLKREREKKDVSICSDNCLQPNLNVGIAQGINHFSSMSYVILTAIGDSFTCLNDSAIQKFLWRLAYQGDLVKLELMTKGCHFSHFYANLVSGRRFWTSRKCTPLS